MKIALCLDEQGVWQFHEGTCDRVVYAELRGGGVRTKGLDGRIRIHVPPDLEGLTADQAVRAGLLEIPVVQSSK